MRSRFNVSWMSFNFDSSIVHSSNFVWIPMFHFSIFLILVFTILESVKRSPSFYWLFILVVSTDTILARILSSSSTRFLFYDATFVMNSSYQSLVFIFYLFCSSVICRHIFCVIIVYSRAISAYMLFASARFSCLLSVFARRLFSISNVFLLF